MSYSTETRANLRAAVGEVPLWYHTMDLGEGVVTPGWFDLRPIVCHLPWPEVNGARCLDVGTYDGFLAFELERRGAAEVVALDIADHSAWDWPADARAAGPETLAAIAGPEKGAGFQLARRALGSAVERLELNVYDLDPEGVGTFDVVVCGSLLLHLRDPVAALEAIRRVCRGVLLSSETVDLALSLRHRRPVAALTASSHRVQWWIPSVAGHRRMVTAAGFDVVRATRPYCIPYGPGHGKHQRPRAPFRRLSDARRSLTRRALTGNDGVPHAAVLASPRI